MKALLITLALAAALALAFFGGRLSAPHTGQAPVAGAPQAAADKLYQCSMHPQIISTEPGKCPICQMDLEAVEHVAPAERGPAASKGAVPGAPVATVQSSREILFYRHPMRPDVTSPTPSKDEMGMDYVPVYADDANASAGASEVPGRASFKLSSERQQLIGVRRGAVEMRELAKQIRTFGTVAYDPELYRALVEYRQAAGRAGAQSLAGAATLRLRQMGLTDDLIKTLARFDPQTLLLPGKEVWIYAQVFEYEIDLLRPGQAVTVRAETGSGRTYTGEIVAVDSILSAETRSVRARILVPTPDASLRPQTFVHVTVDVPLGRKLAVPEDAVFDTGERRFVFVVTGGGTFQPRAVELGAHAGEWFEARAGLREGENVVTSANFLIDSESRFRAAVAAFTEKPPAAHRD